MGITVRPPQESDLDVLTTIDAGYSAAHGVPVTMTLGALRFFERSGHSYVAEIVSPEGEAAVAGFLFAQAVWSGDSPTVHATRLAALPAGATSVRSALIKALVKSAYDAGVYDLSFRTPASDSELRQALEIEGYLPDDHVTLQLVLGARSAAWAASRRG